MLEHIDEFDDIIKSLNESDALKHIVLIGSWTLHVYQYKYPEIESDLLTTNDVDFSIHRAFDTKKTSSPSIRASLNNLGYESFPKGGPPEGQIFKPDITHGEKELAVEFLCAPGRHIKDPYLVKGLSVVATPVKHQDVLLDNIEKINYKEMVVNVPKPEFYAAHKISISQKRTDPDKEEKDLLCASKVIKVIGQEKVLEIGNDGKASFNRNFKTGWNKLQKLI